MIHLVAVLDADVLVPILSCDLLLSMFEAQLFRPVVDTKILSEVERNLIADFPHIDPAALQRRVQQMAEALTHHTHASVDLADDDLQSINPKDRHVAAIAIAQHAAVIVTNDRRLRREANALGTPLRAVPADEFACQLLEREPEHIQDVIDTLVAKRKRIPTSRRDLLIQLAKPFPEFIARVRKMS